MCLVSVIHVQDMFLSYFTNGPQIKRNKRFELGAGLSEGACALCTLVFMCTDLQVAKRRAHRNQADTCGPSWQPVDESRTDPATAEPYSADGYG